MDDNNERVYYAHEVKQVLLSLKHVYDTAPWYMRWYFKAWNDALDTALMALMGEQLVQEQREDSALDTWRSQL